MFVAFRLRGVVCCCVCGYIHHHSHVPPSAVALSSHDVPVALLTDVVECVPAVLDAMEAFIATSYPGDRYNIEDAHSASVTLPYAAAMHHLCMVAFGGDMGLLCGESTCAVEPQGDAKERESASPNKFVRRAALRSLARLWRSGDKVRCIANGSIWGTVPT